MEKTFFIIKPEALRNSELIKEIIIKNGLEIVITKKLILSPETIKAIYPDVKSDLLKAHILFMTKRQSEVGIVRGQNAVWKLLEISGTETDPSICATGTIRNIFGQSKLYRVGNALYYKNAFHRSQNKMEAKRDIRLFSTM